ncbi:hypothetical protein TA3x_002062 [Tundrisphaera sp. TA3]|uniref:hypothetical protein n=1 Tax=Tundrisphaera sp. TA3 TaxID=3435775 RepID=UPI003EB7EA64
MTFHLPGGRSLVLAGGDRAGLWLAAGGIALALLLILYREERRLVSRRAGLGLIALRVLAALALVAALFEPIAARSISETVRGRVIVAVDASASMETADASRSADLPRREVARRLIEGQDAALGSFGADHDVRAATFGRGVIASGPLADVAATLRTPARPDDPARLATDWTAALAPALEGTESAPVVGVVLVTDGRANAGDPADDLAARLKAKGVPVYPVLVGSASPPKDVAIATVRAPETVQVGDSASVAVSVKADGLPTGSEVGVVLTRPGGEPIRQSVRVPGDGSCPVASFQLPFPKAGVFPLTVAIDPAAPGDARTDNDRRTVAVRVADDPARVLLVDGEARWEFRYLRDALGRDPRIKVDAIVFRQPGDPADPTRWPDLGPDAADTLARFDLIVLGDIAPADVDPDTWARLDHFVAARGGTLAILPGPRSLDAWSGDARGRALLPVLDPRPLDVPADATDPARPILPPGLAVIPSPSALADRDGWPMLQIGDPPESAWAALPRLPWVAAGSIKPTATTLATAAGSDAAAIAAQPYGLGKVLWVGTDATWRWRFRVGDATHARFWGQVVRWAGPGGLAVGNTVVRHGPARPRSTSGVPIALRARLADDVPDLPASPMLVARIVPRDAPPGAEGLALVPLRSTPGRPGLFEADAPSLPPGAYAVRLDAPQLARFRPIPEAPLDVVAAETSETVELAADRAPLDLLARGTGGRVFPEHEAGQIPPLLRSTVRTVSRTVETPLWDHPASLALFFALLTAEWALRKKVGLP